MKQINFLKEGSNTLYPLNIDLPDRCPFCNTGIDPEPMTAYLNGDLLQVVVKCPINNCKRLFIGIYEIYKRAGLPSSFFHSVTLPSPDFAVEKFNDEIKSLSPEFSDIYNQAFSAEQVGLFHICGMGYRKALEFLIKDYLKNIFPDASESIENMLLGKCIREYVTDVRIKSMAERAAWLGNDETHYIRRHDDMDVKDLKILIKLTLHWIEAELLTAEYMIKLP